MNDVITAGVDTTAAAAAVELQWWKKPPLVQARGPVFIGIDVQADGKLKVVLWRGDRWDAIYRSTDKKAALARFLPQAIDEAIEFAQASSVGSSEGS